MKKIITISTIILMMIGCLINTTFAVEPSYIINISTTKNELNKGDTFEVAIAISNIVDDKGIVALGGTLEYDKTSLELLEMSGKGSWAAPTHNKANGILVTERNGYTTNSETVFTIVFKVKEESKENLRITLGNISASNGDQDIITGNTSVSIKIKSQDTTVIPPAEGEQGGNNKPENNLPVGENSNQNNNTNVGGDANTLPPTNTNFGTTTNNGSNYNTNKKPTKVNSNTVKNNNANMGANVEDLQSPEEVVETEIPTVIEENNFNEVPNNVILSTNIKETDEDLDFNYPLLIGGTMAIISAEIAVVIIKKKTSIKKSVQHNNIIENVSNDSIDNNTNIIENEDKDFSQDNSYGSDTQNRGNDIGRNSYENRIPKNENSMIGNTCYNIMQNGNEIKPNNVYNRDYHNRYNDIKY